MEIGGARIEDAGTRRARVTANPPAEMLGASLAWLASGARELDWVLQGLPTTRWREAPPPERRTFLGDWSAARHVRHLALYESLRGLPAIRAAAAGLGGSANAIELEGQDAAWDPGSTDEFVVRTWVSDLAAARYAMLAVAESAPDRAWHETSVEAPGLAWLIGRSHQHELEHLASLWRLVLYWDLNLPPADAGHTPSGLPLQSSDLRLGAPPQALASRHSSHTH